jgi:peptidoglycan hydrolase-like protein with peptidoglycan-binding domain
MMWNRYSNAIIAISFGLATSLGSYQMAIAARSRDYTPREMHSVLRGFGYEIILGDTLTNQASVNAIRQFQQGYKLPVDGSANSKTQDYAADLVKILQTNLNIVVKPNPALPVNQFYGPQTEAAVMQFQRKLNLPDTGIATLQVRQRLDEEAKKLLSQPSESRSPSSSPSASPLRSPNPSSSPLPQETPIPLPNPPR